MASNSIESLDPKKNIIIKGAKMHNLKNIDVAIPRNQFVVITGLSGSGKSSLAFDTLYAEGQRRYVESLSSYARQFMGKIDKPEVDYIKGISPAVAIQQKVNTRNPRSTVGTTTEIYDYLKLLFSRAGRTYSPKSGREVKRDTVTDVVSFVFEQEEGTRLLISAPYQLKKDRPIDEQFNILKQQGFNRLLINKEIVRIDDIDTATIDTGSIHILIDRVVVKHEDEDTQNRIADSAQTSFYEGAGDCSVWVMNGKDMTSTHFNNRFELDGMAFEQPSSHFFSFNNPLGACKTCEGFGSVIGIDEDLVIPNKGLSVYDDAIVCWKGEKMSEWKQQLVMTAPNFDFPIHRPIKDLTPKQQQLLWTGNRYFEGLDRFFKSLEEQSYKIQYRVMLSRYRGKTLCPDCNGTRLRKDASYVKINNKSIAELVLMPVDELTAWFKNLDQSLNEHDKQVAKRLFD